MGESMIKNKNLKRRIVEISYKLKLGHIGSCLTAVDIIDEIYDKKKADEKVIISAGHAHLAHLVVKEALTIKTGRLNIEELIKEFGIHCDRQAGCDASTGSLGHGIGIAVGMALVDRTKNVYCLLSDGELAEGSVYEAMNVIQDRQLQYKNLKLYINSNGYAAYRKTFIQDFFGDNAMINVVDTNMDDYPEWLQGQIAHYKVLNEQEYNELIEILK